MDFGWIDILNVLGALAFFIYGMKVMSEGIQRAAGSQLRNILRTMTKNRYLGVLTGFLTTAAVQSSSATTVMTVSFVNAGLITLVESAGIMMGANVGTTITGWIISLLGFKFKLHFLSLPLLAVGLPMLFINRGKLRFWGEFIIGFALLFMGLSMLKDQVPDLQNNPAVLQWLTNFGQYGILSRIFFVLVGATLTIIVQSSSAAMALTMTMCVQGWLPLEVGAAMILGENIGTTVTAEIASLVGNVHSKRSARIHSLFNLIGVSWMVLAMPLVLKLISFGMQAWFGMGNPFDNSDDIPTAISAFHTVFNTTNVLLLIWFVPWLVRMAIRTVPDSKSGEDDIQHLDYMSTMSKTPEISILEVQKEIAKYGDITNRMLAFSEDLLFSVKSKEQQKLIKKVRKYEDITDRIELELAEYLTKLSRSESTEKVAIRIRSYLSINSDLERIGDIFYQMSKTIERKIDKKIWFNQHQRERLQEMIALLHDAFDNMNVQLQTSSYDTASKTEAMDIEKRINKQRNIMRKENLRHISNEDYNIHGAIYYNNIFSQMERVGDHIMNVVEGVMGEI